EVGIHVETFRAGDNVNGSGISARASRSVVQGSCHYQVTDAVAVYIAHRHRRSQQVAGCFPDERGKAGRVPGRIDDSGIAAVTQVQIHLSVILPAVRTAGIHLAEYDIGPPIPIDIAGPDGKSYLTTAADAAV